MYRYFKRNGPGWHVSQGRRLSIPVLLGQGATDTLFSLQQGFDNWQHALTKRSRKQSIFVGYNGGHVLPGAATAVPPGNSPSGDPCSEQLAGGDFTDLTIRFMDEQLKGRDRGLTGYGDVPPGHPRQHLHDGVVGGTGPTRDVRHRGDARGRRSVARLPGRRGADPDRRLVVPHRHADDGRGDEPRVLRPGRRHQPGRRARWSRTTSTR